MPTIENGEPTDVDPFTIYAFFNRQVTEERRIAIIKSLNEEFNVGGTIPSDFNGIPVVNNLNTAFFGFKDKRGEKDIDNIWEFFDIVIRYQNDSSLRDEFIKYYDILQKQIKWNLTICYIAITRAKEFLHISLADYHYISGIRKKLRPSLFMSEIK